MMETSGSASKARLTPFQLFPLVPRDSDLREVPPGGLVGVCPVCSNQATFTGFVPELERESGFCSECTSFNRQRQMATVFRAVCGQNETGPLDFPEGFVIYNTESTRAFHNLLSTVPGYICSEYFGPGIPSGPYAGETRHEDLQCLSLDSESVDLVISTDVLEHVPHPYRAHSEIFRVLRPGGQHIFTMPFYLDSPLDDVRTTEAHGHVTYHKKKVFHGDPMKPGDGALVWTLPGLQMLIELARIGFEVSMYNLHEPRFGIIGPWSIVFVAAKK